MKNLLLIISFLICSSSIAQNKKSFLRNGNELYADSSYNKAEIQYRKSLAKDQDYFNASFNLADAIYKQERYDEASALFNALEDNAPSKNDLAKVYHNLGNSLVKEQKLKEAINAYKNALRINPDDDDTRHNLALSTRMKQNQENQENQEEQKENQEEQKENQEEQKENPEENKQEMSKEAAEKMLEAIQEQEKDLQKEMQKKKVKGKKVKILKDW